MERPHELLEAIRKFIDASLGYKIVTVWVSKASFPPSNHYAALKFAPLGDVRQPHFPGFWTSRYRALSQLFFKHVLTGLD